MKYIERYIAKTVLASIVLVLLMLTGLQAFIFFVNQIADLGKEHYGIAQALLFIVLTFGVLMLFELLKRLRIHPVQYTLVGFALLVFYLLLISLSEHMAFLMAYALAASASTGLLTLYFGAILRSRRLGWCFKREAQVSLYFLNQYSI